MIRLMKEILIKIIIVIRSNSNDNYMRRPALGGPRVGNKYEYNADDNINDNNSTIIKLVIMIMMIVVIVIICHAQLLEDRA